MGTRKICIINTSRLPVVIARTFFISQLCLISSISPSFWLFPFFCMLMYEYCFIKRRRICFNYGHQGEYLMLTSQLLWWTSLKDLKLTSIRIRGACLSVWLYSVRIISCSQCELPTPGPPSRRVLGALMAQSRAAFVGLTVPGSAPLFTFYFFLCCSAVTKHFR